MRKSFDKVASRIVKMITHFRYKYKYTTITIISSNTTNQLSISSVECSDRTFPPQILMLLPLPRVLLHKLRIVQHIDLLRLTQRRIPTRMIMLKINNLYTLLAWILLNQSVCLYRFFIDGSCGRKYFGGLWFFWLLWVLCSLEFGTFGLEL